MNYNLDQYKAIASDQARCRIVQESRRVWFWRVVKLAVLGLAAASMVYLMG